MDLTRSYLNRFVDGYGLRLEELTVEIPGYGRTFAFALEGHTPRGMERPVPGVIFFHGTGNDSIFPHLGLFYDLLQKGYRVMSFDLPGHGTQSTTVLSATGQFALVTGVVEHLLKNLRDRNRSLGPGPCWGIGYSLGGAYLAHLAALEPFFAGLVLVATPVTLKLGWQAAVCELLAPAMGDIYAHKHLYGWRGLFPAVGPFGRRHFPLRLAEQRVYWDVVRDVIEACQVEASLQKARVRTQLIYAQWDRIAHPQQGVHLASTSGLAEFLSVIPHHTHYSLLFWRQLGDRVVEFFER